MQESGEMYLESIYSLLKEKSKVRSIDVVAYMGYSKPSVSRAIGILKKEEYITVDADGYINLCEKGIAAAEKIYERHTILTRFFENLGVSTETASEDACRVEHVISDETFEAVKKTLEK